MRHTRFWVALCLPLLVVIGVARPDLTEIVRAATPTYLASVSVPDSRNTKFPDIVGVGDTVHVIGNPGDNSSRVARVWSKQDKSTSFGEGTSLDGARGQTDYSTASIAQRQGVLYAAWLSQSDQKIYFRRKLSNGWESRRNVHGGQHYYVRTGVTGDERIFITWRDLSHYYYVMSTNGGEGWTDAIQLTSQRPSAGAAEISGGPGGSALAAFSNVNGDIYANIWNGGGFESINITGDLGGYAADPTTAIAPDGTMYIAWRVVGGGVYYAQRQSNGGWVRSRIIGGESYGTPSLTADAQGNLHLIWSSNISGNFDVWYAFKPANGNWQSPVRSASDPSLQANAQGTATVSDRVYGHGVSERFTSSGLEIRYYLFRAQSTPACDISSVVVEGGTGYTRNTTFNLAITPASNCSPASMQISVGAPPASDNNPGRIGYQQSSTVTIPQNLLGNCQQTVYVRLFDSQGNPGKVASVNFLLDLGVQATISAMNPNIFGGPDNTGAIPGTAFGPGSDGDPRFTRDTRYQLKIRTLADCTGLARFSAGNSSNVAIPQNTYYSSILPLPGDRSQPGLHSFNVLVTDVAGNSQNYSRAMIYDPLNTPGTTDNAGRPRLNSGSLVSDDSNAAARKRIIRTLQFSNINVTDNFYNQANGVNVPSNAQFWGVWIAVAPVNTAPAANDPSLKWLPVRVARQSTNFSIKWSLFSGQNYGLDANKAGKYTVYVRFMDGAGNISSGALKTTFTLDSGYGFPRFWMPMLTKR